MKIERTTPEFMPNVMFILLGFNSLKENNGGTLKIHSPKGAILRPVVVLDGNADIEKLTYEAHINTNEETIGIMNLV